MALMTKQEMKRMPIVDDPSQAAFGVVRIDLDKCEGCKMCTIICPSDVLEMFGEGKHKKARVKEGLSACLACDNCHAICDSDAISIEKPCVFTGRYRVLDRSELAQPRKF